MKVYVLEEICYDYHEFRAVVGVYDSLYSIEKIMNPDDKLFESESSELEEFKKVTDLDGITHYEYAEHEVTHHV